MKFKEIKPGMIIHCPKEEDAKALLEYLESLRYGRHINLINWVGENTCYVINIENKWVTRSDTKLYSSNHITEFSDLIEPELSNAEIEEREWEKFCEEENSTKPIVKNVDKWECVYTDRGMMEGFQCDCGYKSLSASNYCPGCGKNMYDDSPINSPINSPMTTEEVLRWLFEHYNDGEYERAFGSNYVFTELMAAYEDNVGEIIQRIEQYEAAKKAPKPVEVECGYRCKVYTEDDLIIEYVMWNVDEKTAKDDAADRAIKESAESGEMIFTDVRFVCHEHEKEDK